MNQKQIHDLQKENNWEEIGNILSAAGQELQSIGIKGLALCANTTHHVYEQVQGTLKIPVLHIGDSVGKVIQNNKYKTVALMGTIYTMEGDFIRGRLKDTFDITTLVPKKSDRQTIQTYLYDEMSHGNFSKEAQDYFCHLINDLKNQGAQAVILGCTEFPILLRDTAVELPIIDSTECHVKDISQFILAGE